MSEIMSRQTQIVEMGLEGVGAERALFAAVPEAGLPGLFGERFPHAHFLYHDYALYRQDKKAAEARGDQGYRLSFAARCDRSCGLHDLGVIYLPKGNDLIEFVFSSVSAALQAGARVLIVGPKQSGIRSSEPLVEKYFGPVLERRSARHCVLIEAEKNVEAAPFDGERSHSVEILGRELKVITLPGTFSHGRLDEGTALLLETIDIEALDFERALDWGCGAGAIGAALKLAHPGTRVDMVDSNVMALEAARETLRANGLEADCVWASDVFSDVPGRYDLIVSNPPYHSGLKADFSVTERLIREAGEHLTGSGRLVLVSNAFGKCLRLARGCLGEAELIARRGLYGVIEGKRA